MGLGVRGLYYTVTSIVFPTIFFVPFKKYRLICLNERELNCSAVLVNNLIPFRRCSLRNFSNSHVSGKVWSDVTQPRLTRVNGEPEDVSSKHHMYYVEGVSMLLTR